MERTADEGLIAQAKAAVAKANAGPNATRAYPALMPVDVTTGEGGPSRVWLVTVEGPLPASIVPGSMINLDGWDASGAVLRDSWLHGVEDGIRWKSSHGVIENNLWERPLTALSGRTGLEVTLRGAIISFPVACPSPVVAYTSPVENLCRDRTTMAV